MANEGNIFRIIGPAEGCILDNIIIKGANHDYCNKINGVYNKTSDIENNYNIFVKDNDQDIKLHYVLRPPGFGIGWKITNSTTGIDYCYIINNQRIWYEYKYLSRNNYLGNMDICVEIIPENENENNNLEEYGSNQDERQCVICLSEPSTFGVLHQGSMHLCMCRACAQLFSENTCPVCRTGVERVVRVYG